jgi:hypothetical protein
MVKKHTQSHTNHQKRYLLIDLVAHRSLQVKRWKVRDNQVPIRLLVWGLSYHTHGALSDRLETSVLLDSVRAGSHFVDGNL